MGAYRYLTLEIGGYEHEGAIQPENQCSLYFLEGINDEMQVEIITSECRTSFSKFLFINGIPSWA